MQEWHPFPKQEFALQRAEFEVLFGGSRGPGKTDAGLVWLIGEEYEPGKVLLNHPRYRALVIRKNAEDLSDWIDRAYRFYSSFGVDIAYKPAILRFPSGAVIRTGHLKDDQSYTKYMGQEFPRILLEELTQIPLEKRYLQLIASCRSTVAQIPPQIFATTNPGGLGHGWVKKRFVDPALPMTPFKDPTSGRTRIFIPATVDDNPILNKIDPDYIKMLDALKDTDEELYKAWRLGDWNTFAGQYFREWADRLHTCNPFIPLKTNVIVGGMDWGRAKPFSFHLAEVKRVMHDEVVFYRVRTFLEVYGTEKTPAEWWLEIKKKLDSYGVQVKDIAWVQADPSMFTKLNDGSISIADQFIKANGEFGRKLKPGSNDRVGGWTNYHTWLSIAPDGLPYYQVSTDCPNLIRTLPELVHDENKVEDVDSTGEDHAPDDQRYMLKKLKHIDASSGAVAQIQTRKPLTFAPQFIDNKQVSINLDSWEDPKQTTGDVGGVAHD